jgi:cytochrome c-type biogenesis protein CcmH/NrfG
MNRDIVIGLGIGFLGGFLVGYFLGARPANEPVPAALTAPPAQTSPAQPPPVNPLEIQSRISAAEAAVAKDPKDLQAWINLGNDYFDIHQAQKSVDAYARALALKPDNPDVLTDQGVMYRELKAYDKALACFERANRVNPRHLQSLFNIGVVYAHDLKNPDKAIAAWNKLIAADPTSAQADQARQGIESLKAQR